MPKIKTIIWVALSLVLIAALVVMLVFSQKLYLKKAYPVKYTQYVEKYAQEYELDRYFVYSIIRCESDFQKDAVSSIGARGLMQITNETFDWIKGKLKDNDSTFDSMFNEEKAIEYGCYLLSYLKKSLGSENNLLCGYHAGVNRAKIWLEDNQFARNGEIIVENIPYPDTKMYVQKVMKTYEIYKKLYS